MAGIDREQNPFTMKTHPKQMYGSDPTECYNDH